ncbi:MAG: hypothetical protein AAFY56_14575 [Pseudomonadota bacterium]
MKKLALIAMLGLFLTACAQTPEEQAEDRERLEELQERNEELEQNN